MLICPLCKCNLYKDSATYKCQNSHSFDISKSGYTNLLISKSNAGDNKEMIFARNNFLAKGYYKNLALKIKQIVISNISDVIVDAGCGTGYYSSFLNEDGKRKIFGFDISKFAIEKASKNQKQNQYFVSSCANIPLKENCADIILTIFAPTFETEFDRILKKDGAFILVTPGKNHLYELKELLYDNPYFNTEKEPKLNLFKKKEKFTLEYKETLNQEDILNLLKMTPYFYKTNPKSFENLKISSLDITFDFDITVYKKTSFSD